MVIMLQDCIIYVVVCSTAHNSRLLSVQEIHTIMLSLRQKTIPAVLLYILFPLPPDRQHWFMTCFTSYCNVLVSVHYCQVYWRCVRLKQACVEKRRSVRFVTNRTIRNYQCRSIGFPSICKHTAFSKQNCLIGCPHELQPTSKVQNNILNFIRM